MKIGIGVAHYGTIWARTALSLMDLMKLPYEFFNIFQYGPYVSQNREDIVKAAIDNKCTHLLFVDHDIQFFPVAIDILIKHDMDIVGGMYHYRAMPIGRPMVKMLNDKKEMVDIDKDKVPYDMFRTAGVGMGCTLIKMSVFEKLEKPYFPMFTKGGKVETSEDIGFCEKARAAGFNIWCDPTLDVKHLGTYEF